MWLCACRSNNRPDYVAKLFITCVRNVGGSFNIASLKYVLSDINFVVFIKKGCPTILRTDLGTENSTIAVVQSILRHGASDGYAGEKSHRYGKSMSNQVINHGV